MRHDSRIQPRRKRSFERRLLLENLEARHLLAADFGDAPAPYPVTLDDDGARHESIGPQLGATRDAESNGAPSQNAEGDGNDKDGPLFGVFRPWQLNATVAHRFKALFLAGVVLAGVSGCWSSGSGVDTVAQTASDAVASYTPPPPYRRITDLSRATKFCSGVGGEDEAGQADDDGEGNARDVRSTSRTHPCTDDVGRSR